MLSSQTHERIRMLKWFEIYQKKSFILVLVFFLNRICRNYMHELRVNVSS